MPEIGAVLRRIAGVLALVLSASTAVRADDVAFPEGKGPFGLAILVPGCGGAEHFHVAQSLARHAGRLREIGYASVLFDETGGKDICTEAGKLKTLELAGAGEALAIARRHAADPRIDPARIVILGQSFGGSVALRAASIPSEPANPLRAVIAYYPWCGSQYGDEPGKSRFLIPVLVLAAANDDWTPVERCQKLEAAAGSHKARIEIYADAQHSFDLPGLPVKKIPGVGGVYTMAASATATEESIGDYLDFLRRLAN